MNPLSRLVGRAVDKAIGLPPATATYVLRRDVGAPMPDGVVLLGDLYQPDGPDRARPVVLIRSPYGRAGIAGAVFAAPLARRGFQVFIQSTRGTFGSGGQFRPFLHEQEDGLATVAWLRQQPWCDGRVSMTGASYLGHTQWAIAPYVDPPLESVSMHVTAAKITSASTTTARRASAMRSTGRRRSGRRNGAILPGLVPRPLTLARMKAALRKMPLQAADVDVTGAPVAFWRDFVAHGDPGDQFWATRRSRWRRPGASAAGDDGDRVVGFVPALPAARLHCDPGGRRAGQDHDRAVAARRAGRGQADDPAGHRLAPPPPARRPCALRRAGTGVPAARRCLAGLRRVAAARNDPDHVLPPRARRPGSRGPGGRGRAAAVHLRPG